jgi:hypothetical protein
MLVRSFYLKNKIKMNIKPSKLASSPTPRPSAGPWCPARKLSSGAGLTLPCRQPTVPGTARSFSTTCAIPRYGNSTRATPRPRARCSGSFAICFVYRTLLDAEINNAEEVSRKIKRAFVEFPNWKKSENSLRDLRQKVTFAVLANSDDLDRVTALVDQLFTLLEKSDARPPGRV